MNETFETHSTTTLSSLRERLVEARAMLLFLHPFLGYLVTHLGDEVGAVGVDTFDSSRTDGTTVFWSGPFLASLTRNDTMFVLAHHALHCALGHLWPRAARDRPRWDAACDALVNERLVECGLAHDVSSGLIARLARPQSQDRGATLERLYRDSARPLHAIEVPVARLDAHDRWVLGEALAPGDRDRFDRWRCALAEAAKFSMVPPGLGRDVEALVAPRRDWREILREGLFWQADYTFTPTDRRIVGPLVPTLHGEIRRVVIAIDLRQAWGNTLRVFWGEALSILRNNHCEAWVVAFDDGGIRAAWDGYTFEDAMVTEKVKRDPPLCGSLAEFVEGRADAGWETDALVCLTPMISPPPVGLLRLERVFWLVPPSARSRIHNPKPPAYGVLIDFDLN